MNLALACRLAAAAELLPRAPTTADLLSSFGGAERLARAGRSAWRRASLPPPVLRILEQGHPSEERVPPDQPGLCALAWEDDAYPESLRQLAVPPPVLFVAGQGPLAASSDAVAVIGARKASEAGRWVARDLAQKLAAEGLAIGSGLALGVDAAAHGGALSAKGRTFAVLASDVCSPGPRRNRPLADHILRAGGHMISERPFGAPIRPWDFPRRNRLIAALCQGVVVVEAGRASGTLSTVRWALDLGLPVGAVPGAVNRPGCQGSNDLLRQGAHVITCAQDVLDMVGPPRGGMVPSPRPRSAPNQHGGNENELQRVLEGIPEVSAGLSGWILGSGLEPERARNAIAVLLARGDLRRLPGGRLGRSL